MLVLASVVGGVLVLLLGLVVARWWAARGIDDLGSFEDDYVTDRLALLPEGHRPPPGLSPLSPSERFLANEASRGLRELQLFLHEAV